MSEQANRTIIYKITSDESEIPLGYIGSDLGIYRLVWGEGRLVGRVDTTGRVFRKTAYDERELGLFTPNRHIRSHGLFEGGELGWVEPDGVVVQAGYILGEEEVGRVDGPQDLAAGAALLLLFLPDAAEENH